MSAEAEEARQFELFLELHSEMPRQGPGNRACTERALAACGEVAEAARVLDIGCGPGAQTRDLSLALPQAKIIALDNHTAFLRELNTGLESAGCQDQVRAIRGDMNCLPFAHGAFDLIWAEGSIYCMGFEAGLRAWRGFLATSGSLAVSELSWIGDGPAGSVRDYWAAAYPAIQTIEGNVALMENAGYSEIATFALPAEAFWEDYYRPLQKRLREFAAQHADDPLAAGVIEATEEEIAMYEQYADFVGYVFYIGRKLA